MEDDARNLAWAANRAAEARPDSKGGAPADEAFHKLLDILIDVYEESTGRKATYFHGDSGYHGRFIGFAAGALKLCQVSKTNDALGKALERKLTLQKTQS